MRARPPFRRRIRITHDARSYSAAIIFEITYGHRVHSNEDEYFRMSEQFVRLLLDAGQPSLLDISEHCMF